ncbi:MAG: DUF6111 family protein [Geminicoccaceae bacterium]
MLRIIFETVLPFLLPFLAYAAWRRWGGSTASVAGVPWSALSIAGGVLVIIAFVGMALLGGEDPHGEYVPPHMERGRVVPGRVIEAQ